MNSSTMVAIHFLVWGLILYRLVPLGTFILLPVIYLFSKRLGILAIFLSLYGTPREWVLWMSFYGRIAELFHGRVVASLLPTFPPADQASLMAVADLVFSLPVIFVGVNLEFLLLLSLSSRRLRKLLRSRLPDRFQ